MNHDPKPLNLDPAEVRRAVIDTTTAVTGTAALVAKQLRVLAVADSVGPWPELVDAADDLARRAHDEANAWLERNYDGVVFDLVAAKRAQRDAEGPALVVSVGGVDLDLGAALRQAIDRPEPDCADPACVSCRIMRDVDRIVAQDDERPRP